jgi:hypothetical protein
VTTVTATDPGAVQTLSYSIAGGADASLFTINTMTGALDFGTAPNFEAPADAGANNVYDVTVQVSDGNGGIDTQVIADAVQDVAGVTINGTGQAERLPEPARMISSMARWQRYASGVRRQRHP